MVFVFEAVLLSRIHDRVLTGQESAVQVAAKALVFLCTEDGKFNGSTVGLKSVLAYLEEEAVGGSAPDDMPACLQSLQRLLNGPCTADDAEAWIRQWYVL